MKISLVSHLRRLVLCEKVLSHSVHVNVFSWVRMCGFIFPLAIIFWQIGHGFFLWQIICSLSDATCLLQILHFSCIKCVPLCDSSEILWALLKSQTLQEKAFFMWVFTWETNWPLMQKDLGQRSQKRLAGALLWIFFKCNTKIGRSARTFLQRQHVCGSLWRSPLLPSMASNKTESLLLDVWPFVFCNMFDGGSLEVICFKCTSGSEKLFEIPNYQLMPIESLKTYTFPFFLKTLSVWFPVEVVNSSGSILMVNSKGL